MLKGEVFVGGAVQVKDVDGRIVHCDFGTDLKNDLWDLSIGGNPPIGRKIPCLSSLT